jgi:hypothetical protein
MLIVDPTFIMSRIDSDEPIVDIPYVEHEEPRRAILRRLMLEPIEK